MKYLKEWKLFENSETQSDILDICQELIDLKKVNVDIIPSDRVSSQVYGKCDFVVYFSEYDFRYMKGLHITDLAEFLIRIKDYLGDSFASCQVLFNGEREREVVDLSDERQLIGELYGRIISDVAIFVKSVDNIKESSTNPIASYSMIQKYGIELVTKTDDIIKEIKEILLDLSDVGIEYSVNYSPITLVGREEGGPKIVIQAWPDAIKSSEYYELIEDTFQRIKGYVTSLGYATGFHHWSDNSRFEDDDKAPKIYQMLVQ